MMCMADGRPPMQCQVMPASENTKGGSLRLENKGAGEDASAASEVTTAAVSTNPGMFLVLGSHRLITESLFLSYFKTVCLNTISLIFTLNHIFEIHRFICRIYRVILQYPPSFTLILYVLILHKSYPDYV